MELKKELEKRNIATIIQKTLKITGNDCNADCFKEEFINQVKIEYNSCKNIEILKSNPEQTKHYFSQMIYYINETRATHLQYHVIQFVKNHFISVSKAEKPSFINIQHTCSGKWVEIYDKTNN